jgi:hypothetical protein
MSSICYFYSFQVIFYREKEFPMNISHVNYIIYPKNHRKTPYGSVFTNEYQILVVEKVAFLFVLNDVIWKKNFLFSHFLLKIREKI